MRSGRHRTGLAREPLSSTMPCASGSKHPAPCETYHDNSRCGRQITGRPARRRPAVARHPRRRPRPPTLVLGIAAILLALVVALAVTVAPGPDPRPAGLRLTPLSTAFPPGNVGEPAPLDGRCLEAAAQRPETASPAKRRPIS